MSVYLRVQKKYMIKRNWVFCNAKYEDMEGGIMTPSKEHN